jgi:beta-glucosidase
MNKACYALAFLAAAPVLAQPVIAPNGIVNAASLSSSVAPGSVATVSGTFPVSAPAVGGMPLPTTLAGLSMQFNGALAAPLFFASGTEATIQIPWGLPWQPTTTLAAAANSQTGAAEAVDLIAFAPGIFTLDGEHGAIQDGAQRIVDASNPATAGITEITIYCTGLGGSPSATELPAVWIGGAPAAVLSAGVVPGLDGIQQVTAVVPLASETGRAVPVTISAGGFTSNQALIAVKAPPAEMDPDLRAAAMLARMTQAEKVQLIHGAGGTPSSGTLLPRGAGGYVPGIPRLGIPALYFADGSVGVANSVGPATALPSSIASAATWDLNQAYRYGKVIGSEMRAYGLNVNLGGNVNLPGREPRCGRIFEMKSEDPILAGKITAAHIRAIQDQHVVGGMKHYALNDQETGRDRLDVRIDERSMRETDLLAFEIAAKGSNVQSVMCSYNLLNGTYACENPHLLNEVLKEDWGFQGFVMSDWWATHSTVNAALAGLDQEQPNPPFFGTMAQYVASGQVPQARLDNMVHRILRAMYQAGLFDYAESLGPIDRETDEAIAQETLEQGAVLLKNEGGQLPLNPSSAQRIAVIGSHADIGVLSGGGSAQVRPTGGAALTEGYPCPPCWSQVIWDPSSPFRAIQAKAPAATVYFDDGTDAARAAALAAFADVSIVFVSQWESEGMDVPSLNFTDVIHTPAVDQDALVAAVAAANPHTIVVMENGGPKVMPWLNSVSAVLEAWYPGQRGGEAIANLLFGAVNPSGKLPLTFPASVADLPRPVIAIPPETGTFQVPYTEGLAVGYKWYDSRGITPLFPFGFGLSYTTFAISNAALVDNLAAFQPNFRVTFDLRNTGPVAGAEVAQVYLSLPPSTSEPPRRLVGWQKVFLKPGALQHVTIEVNPYDVSHPMGYWDTGTGDWQIAQGDYTVYLGTSSAVADLSVIGTLPVTTIGQPPF